MSRFVPTQPLAVQFAQTAFSRSELDRKLFTFFLEAPPKVLLQSTFCTWNFFSTGKCRSLASLKITAIKDGFQRGGGIGTPPHHCTYHTDLSGPRHVVLEKLQEFGIFITEKMLFGPLYRGACNFPWGYPANYHWFSCHTGLGSEQLQNDIFKKWQLFPFLTKNMSILKKKPFLSF